MFVTIREAAKYIGVSEHILRRMKKEGELKGFDSPGGRRFHVSLYDCALAFGLDAERVVYEAAKDKAQKDKMRICGAANKEEEGGGKQMNVALEKYGLLPTRAHTTDAGLDIYSPWHYLVPAHGSAVVKTGVHIELPAGTAGMLKSKSGLNVKHDITSEGVIDEGYTGEIIVKVYNHGDEDYEIGAGDKVTQLVVMPVEYVAVTQVNTLDEDTERGSAGFGSTGR